MIHHLKRCTFWNVHIRDDTEKIEAVINKWGVMCKLGKPGVEEIKILTQHFKKFSHDIFDPSRLMEYSVTNPDVQKDWVALRTVIINNFFKSFPNQEKLLGKVKRIFFIRSVNQFFFLKTEFFHEKHSFTIS